MFDDYGPTGDTEQVNPQGTPGQESTGAGADATPQAPAPATPGGATEDELKIPLGGKDRTIDEVLALAEKGLRFDFLEPEYTRNTQELRRLQNQGPGAVATNQGQGNPVSGAVAPATPQTAPPVYPGYGGAETPEAGGYQDPVEQVMAENAQIKEQMEIMQFQMRHPDVPPDTIALVVQRRDQMQQYHNTYIPLDLVFGEGSVLVDLAKQQVGQRVATQAREAAKQAQLRASEATTPVMSGSGPAAPPPEKAPTSFEEAAEQAKVRMQASAHLQGHQ